MQLLLAKLPVLFGRGIKRSVFPGSVKFCYLSQEYFSFLIEIGVREFFPDIPYHLLVWMDQVVSRKSGNPARSSMAIS